MDTETVECCGNSEFSNYGSLKSVFPMVGLLITSVLLVLIVSALCSVSEAALYAVRMPYVRELSEQGSTAGRLLDRFKANMERPITAILIVNTIANTGGAAFAGAQAELIFGTNQVWLVGFSVAFTVAVLMFSEIIPKVFGVVYNKQVSRAVAVPLDLTIKCLYPLVWAVQHISQLLKPSGRVFAAPEEEVKQMAVLSAEEGSILPIEAELVQNVLKLNDVTAEQIMTPRSVVTKLPQEMKLRDVSQAVTEWRHSRLPVFSSDDPEHWVGIVLRRDILKGLAADQFETTISDLSNEIHFVIDTTPGHILLQTFLQRRSHLFGVVNEYNDLVGIVTLEDVLESLLGEEIVDEVDEDVDMQDVARHQHQRTWAPGTDEADQNGTK